MKATVFLGGGRITCALAAGLRLAGYRRAIIVYDRNPEKVRALRRESRVEVARDLKPAVARAEMLIIAVRPGSVREMLGRNRKNWESLCDSKNRKEQEEIRTTATKQITEVLTAEQKLWPAPQNLVQS